MGRQVIAVEPQPRFYSFLQNSFASNSEVTLEGVALGSESGDGTLLVSQRTPTVTSLSQEWVSQVSEDDGFAWVDWDKQVTVPIVTLDVLIEKHGLPAFCKIDVEGYELQVLQGLSHAIATLSFEYIHATMQTNLDCIDQLETLANYSYNFTKGESLDFNSETWMNADTMQNLLRKLPAKFSSGDIYARLEESL